MLRHGAVPAGDEELPTLICGSTVGEHVKKILVKFPSPRMRSIASSMIRVDRSMCSFHQDSGKGGTYEVTSEQLKALKASRADRKHHYRAFRFSVVRKPDDFFPCHRRPVRPGLAGHE